MKHPGCVHESWCGLEVRACSECSYGGDYDACVTFRAGTNAEKIIVEV
ncbi:MAG: hypothetical protein PHN69_07395 [Candidatus Pacebacteria bacterium]|nr:hypothetical protein [Candidatus Paceibacterota bacterium]